MPMELLVGRTRGERAARSTMAEGE